MTPVCVPSRAKILAGTAAATAVVVVAERHPVGHALGVVWWWLPRVLIGLCMTLMLGFAAVCAVAEHRRRVRSVATCVLCGTKAALPGDDIGARCAAELAAVQAEARRDRAAAGHDRAAAAPLTDTRQRSPWR